MNNEITLNFLKTVKVAVIVGEDNKILQDFINHISCCICADLSILDVVQYDCDNHSVELKMATVNKIKDLKESELHYVLPIEFLHREKHYVTALLRSLYLRIPESDQPDIQMFQLHYFADELRLECEFGENAGWYIVYDYDSATGTFREKE